ncbi:phenylpropionate dioxygenase-like ring-hydroxylating dioxygenase large terminal subunit [Pseudacidovorax sp. 1753]|uniref:aromatic ring-hydroxylating dioxygenase subunit alpha n=1 Tax=Pseudacidovorax sp. 1753 TaxID=3156419 RepID=UPI0033982115
MKSIVSTAAGDWVRPDSVHRSAYVDRDVFDAEQRRFFGATWNFVAHDSQLAKPGSYVTLDLAGRPLLVLREGDGSVGVFYNRCAHKGTKLYTDEAGEAGRMLRCPYHAWTYKLDGSPLGIPLRRDYDLQALTDCEAGRGLTRVGAVRNYRGFVFVRLDAQGVGFDDYFGASLVWLDNMADRSPTGRLQVAGGVIRNVMRCNWKMYLENINDSVHPVSAHESAGKSAKAQWEESRPPGQAALPMAVEQLLPFASGYDFFEGMDAEVYPNGHSAMGVSVSSHSAYAQPAGYEEALNAAHGPERTREILGRSPQNVVLYPSIAIKGAPLAMRVIRPLAVDRTLVEAWSFRAEDAPDLLLQRALSYNRLVFSPMSILAHDDVHLFEAVQQGLQADANPWVSLHRSFDPAELEATGTQHCKGTSELLMRNQHRAWSRFMNTMEAE